MPQWAHRLHYSTLNVWAPALASRLYYQHPHNVDMHAHQPKCAHISSWKENVPLLPHLTSPSLFFLLLYYYFFTPSRLFCYAKRQRYGKCFSCWKQKTGWRMKNQVVMNLKKKKKKTQMLVCWIPQRGAQKEAALFKSHSSNDVSAFTVIHRALIFCSCIYLFSQSKQQYFSAVFFLFFWGGRNCHYLPPCDWHKKFLTVKDKTPGSFCNIWPLRVFLIKLCSFFGQ